MDRDLNLLFGVFAVQLRKVPPAQLMEAAGAWAVDPSKSLGARLLEMKAISSADAKLIQRLVNEAVAAYNGDVAATLAALGGEGLVEETFADSLSPKAGRTVHVRQCDAIRYLDGDSVPGVQETPGRYTHVSEYGRGGMGRVLLVHDAFLGRDVAFKELLPGPTPKDPNSPSTPVREYMGFLSRFLQEARITGQLEHPSIVPVYELGHREDGRLYYTMKLVRGRTLRQAMNECKTLTQRLTLLPHFVDLCHAIAYAHSRRIIHRDIKPDNVMVGEFGETVVLDWGLAKSKDSKDFHADGIAETFRLLQLGEIDSAVKTQYGQIMGTPAYMPPEQATGNLEWIDERSDVYSLGAVFYELLTGQRPFSGKDAVEIIRRVVNENPAPIDKTVPPELHAICLKAMQKKPSLRYETASAIAEEVRRFLSGALVKTYNYGWRERLTRTIRRHKAVAITAGVAVLALVVVGASSYVRVVRERDVAVSARSEAEQARAEAVQSKNQTEQAVYHTSLLLAGALTEKSQFDEANETLWKTPEHLRNWEWGYLLGLCNRDRQTLVGHNGPILYGSFRPDDKQIATCGADGTARIWDIGSGELVRTLSFGMNEVSTVEFSPDGKQILIVETNRMAHFFNADTGEKLGSFGSPIGEAVISATFDSTGTKIAAPLLSNHIVVRDVVNEEQITLAGHSDFVNRVAFSPDGRLASASRDGSVKVWDTTTGKELAALDGHGKAVREVDFSPSGNLLVSASFDETARIWDMSTYRELKSLPHKSAVYSARFNASENEIVTGAEDKLVRTWDIKSGTVLQTFKGHSEVVGHVRYDRDGTTILSCGFDGKVKIWSRSEKTEFNAETSRYIESIALSPDNSRLAVTLDTGAIQLWDAASVVPVITLGGINAARAAWSIDGQKLFVYGHRGEALIVDSQTCTIEKIVSPEVTGAAMAHFTADGAQLVAAGFEGDLTFVDVDTNEVFKTIVYPSELMTSFFLHEAGAHAVTGTEIGDVILWDTSEMHAPIVLGRHSNSVTALASNDTAGLIASGSLDGEIRLWNLHDKTPVHKLKAQVNRIHAIAFSPDGSRIAAASADQSVCFWDTRTGNLLFSMTDDKFSYTDLSWSLDGSQVGVATSGQLKLLKTLPWNPNSLPGTQGMPWIDRFAQFKRNLPTRNASSAGESQLHKVVITKHNLEKSLRRIIRILQSAIFERAGSDETGLLMNSAMRDALRYFHVEGVDRLIALNDEVIKGAGDATGVIERFLSAVSSPSVTSATVTFAGTEGARVVQIDLIPQIVRTHSVTLPRSLGVLVLKQGIDSMNAGRATAVEYARRYSENFDMPVFGDEIDGFWVDKVFTSTRDEEIAVSIVESFYKTAGVQYMDHIVRLNGAPLTSFDTLIAELEKGLGILNAAQPFVFTLDIERGRFQRVTLSINFT